ncbi:MAG: hypothetical protein JSS81_25645 [Acidobacteria bacterium]|nr:hypothetical protein [Acidobacteriota bacterium]
MKILTFLLLAAAFLLSGCGESHTYYGTLKNTGPAGTEGKVAVTMTKQSETEATLTFADDGAHVPGLFLTECTYPIKLKMTGDRYWSAESCYLKEGSAELTTGSDGIRIDGKQLKMKFITEFTTPRENRWEFNGTEK